MMQDVESMILTQYNHPGIFIWSIHINESLDDDELYTRANALAHKLDSSRPTTGVRYITNSHLLEDVYSLNDFTYSDCDPDGTKLFKGRREATGLEYPVPFMITEFSGTAHQALGQCGQTHHPRQGLCQGIQSLQPVKGPSGNHRLVRL